MVSMPAAALAVTARTRPGRRPAVAWMDDDGRVLQVRLAHREDRRLCAGALRLDRPRRTLAWVGAPGEIGCRHPWEASFDDLESAILEAPGFLLSRRSGSPRVVRLVPLPHFLELLAAPAPGPRATAEAVRRDSATAVHAILDAAGRGWR